MIYGRVVGTVWATRKEPRLEGATFLIVERLELSGAPTGQHVVAVDSVSAGVGEIVLVAQGSSARQTAATRDRPVDAVIMAIVDNLELVTARKPTVAGSVAPEVRRA
ncbi:MAG: EutN/CcmL family microcompartment protein [Planctomycetota bacterium]